MSTQALLSEAGEVLVCGYCGHVEPNAVLLGFNHDDQAGDCSARRGIASQLRSAVLMGRDLDGYVARARRHGLDVDAIIHAAREEQS